MQGISLRSVPSRRILVADRIDHCPKMQRLVCLCVTLKIWAGMAASAFAETNDFVDKAKRGVAGFGHDDEIVLGRLPIVSPNDTVIVLGRMHLTNP